MGMFENSEMLESVRSQHNIIIQSQQLQSRKTIRLEFHTIYIVTV